MRAALIEVEGYLKTLLIVAAFLMPLFVWFVELAARPSFYECWDTRKAGEYYYDHQGCDLEGLPVSSVDQKVWAFWQKTGFSVFTKGKEDFFKAEIPQLDCTEPLSEAVFKFLQEEIRAVAKRKRDTSLEPHRWCYPEHFMVHDSTYIRTFEKGLCIPEVVSLEEYRCFYPDWAAHDGIIVLGRNFVWNGSAIRELELADLFEGSSEGDWLVVLEKELEVALLGLRSQEWTENFSLKPTRQFFMTREGLNIIFQMYELGGIYSHTSKMVPWERLSSILKPDAPVTQWVEKELQK
jgi:hypothetical protein